MKTPERNKYSFSLFICLCIFCSLFVVLNLKLVTATSSDSNFYSYARGSKNKLVLSKQKLAVRFKQGLTLAQQEQVVDSEQSLGPFSEREPVSTKNMTVLALSPGLTEEDVVRKIASLESKLEVEFVSPVFHFSDVQLILTDVFLVKFDPSVSETEIKAFNALNNAEITRRPKSIDWYTLRVKDPTNMNTLKTANLYYESPITLCSLPNFVVRIKAGSAVFPDDTYGPRSAPDGGEQWALHNIGQDPPGGDDDADIDAPEGWDISTGSPDIVIAVLDTGIDYSHDDLSANIWINEAEYYGDPDVDDDNNGYKDDIRGWDFDDYPEDNDPSPAHNYAGDAHGTACAGLAAAETNNEEGVAGVCWNCKIMPVRICHSIGGGWVSMPLNAYGDGVLYVANTGGDVLSFSILFYNQEHLYDAIKYAKNNGRDGKGCIMAGAAGNSNVSFIEVPAYYPEVIAVGATDHYDDRWDLDCTGLGCGSNYGSRLAVVAPSGWTEEEDVIFWTTDITGGYGYNPGGDLSKGDVDGNYYKWFGGTSAATPEVAGLAALILSVKADLTSDEVQFIIESTADDKGDPGWDEEYGWGRINANQALSRASVYSVFRVKNDSGQPVADFDNFGNLFLKGTLATQVDPLEEDPDHDEFRVQDSEGNEVAIIDTTDGNMYITGERHEGQDMSLLSPEGFIVKKSNGDVVAYIDDSGDEAGHLYLAGKLYQNP